MVEVRRPLRPTGMTRMDLKPAPVERPAIDPPRATGNAALARRASGPG